MAKKKKSPTTSLYTYLTVATVLITVLLLTFLASRVSPRVYEVQSPSAVIVPVTSPSPADLNADGAVNLYDLNILRSNMGDQGEDIPGDLNQDQVVDDRDETILKRSYAK